MGCQFEQGSYSVLGIQKPSLPSQSRPCLLGLWALSVAQSPVLLFFFTWNSTMYSSLTQAHTTSSAPFCIRHNHYMLAWISSWKPSELDLWVWHTATWACWLLSPTCSWPWQKWSIHLSQFPASPLKASSRMSGWLLISTAKFRWKPWNKKQSCHLHQCSMWHFHWDSIILSQQT